MASKLITYLIKIIAFSINSKIVNILQKKKSTNLIFVNLFLIFHFS